MQVLVFCSFQQQLGQDMTYTDLHCIILAQESMQASIATIVQNVKLDYSSVTVFTI